MTTLSVWSPAAAQVYVVIACEAVTAESFGA